MTLGHEDIKKELKSNNLKIENLNKESIRENGIDCRIGDKIAIDYYKENFIIDSHNKESSNRRFLLDNIPDDGVLIPPHTNILLVTKEIFHLPNNLMAYCGLRSTVARMGFIAPITIVDAGFEGTLTIELFWGGWNPIRIYKNDRFLHVIFEELKTPTKNLYDGYYQNQLCVNLPKTIS